MSNISIIVTAYPKNDRSHIVVEHCSSEAVAEQWRAAFRRNGWEVV